MRKILESDELGSVFRAPVLTTQAPLRATLHRLGAMEGSDILPSSTGKIERAMALFEECACRPSFKTNSKASALAGSLSPEMIVICVVSPFNICYIAAEQRPCWRQDSSSCYKSHTEPHAFLQAR